MTAQPIPTISVSISYVDEGPDAACWEHVLIGHPVGKDLTMIGNPASSKAHLFKLMAAAEMLDQLNEIFRRVLLDPRKTAVEDALKQLRES